MSDLRVGIIGMSDGNGHPYSWSAIINGYDPVAMEQCGFPVVPRYLERQQWPQAQIQGAQVTHVWTQDPAVSQSIAQASLIPNVADRLEDLVGKVDAVLLARDDASNHLAHAAPFLQAGLPIYIDKPIATSRAMLERLQGLERYQGQIFTCSALRYAPQLQLDTDLRQQLGRLLHVVALTPKAWETYAVHVVEPVTVILGSDREVELVGTERSPQGGVTVRLVWDTGIHVEFTATSTDSEVMRIEVVGESGTVTLAHPDTFSAFKAALQDFVGGIHAGEIRTNWADVERIVDILETGRG